MEEILLWKLSTLNWVSKLLGLPHRRGSYHKAQGWACGCKGRWTHEKKNKPMNFWMILVRWQLRRNLEAQCLGFKCGDLSLLPFRIQRCQEIISRKVINQNIYIYSLVELLRKQNQTNQTKKSYIYFIFIIIYLFCILYIDIFYLNLLLYQILSRVHI